MSDSGANGQDQSFGSNEPTISSTDVLVGTSIDIFPSCSLQGQNRVDAASMVVAVAGRQPFAQRTCRTGSFVLNGTLLASSQDDSSIALITHQMVRNSSPDSYAEV